MTDGTPVPLEGPVQHFIASYGYAAVFLLKPVDHVLRD
jgi:hypothetical protein